MVMYDLYIYLTARSPQLRHPGATTQKLMMALSNRPRRMPPTS
jgi:hypothetical protein